jgi:hypothetical protein
MYRHFVPPGYRLLWEVKMNCSIAPGSALIKMSCPKKKTDEHHHVQIIIVHNVKLWIVFLSICKIFFGGLA